jgi:hypothetical protein
MLTSFGMNRRNQSVSIVGIIGPRNGNHKHIFLHIVNFLNNNDF